MGESPPPPPPRPADTLRGIRANTRLKTLDNSSAVQSMDTFFHGYTVYAWQKRSIFFCQRVYTREFVFVSLWVHAHFCACVVTKAVNNTRAKNSFDLSPHLPIFFFFPTFLQSAPQLDILPQISVFSTFSLSSLRRLRKRLRVRGSQQCPVWKATYVAARAECNSLECVWFSPDNDYIYIYMYLNCTKPWCFCLYCLGIFVREL